MEKLYNSFTSWIDKKDTMYMSHFPEPFHPTLNKIKLELNLANYEKKSDLKESNLC